MRRMGVWLPAGFVLLLLLVCRAGIAGDQGLLWRIEGQGAHACLFGTMHSDDPRVTQLSDAVTRCFNESDILMLEMALDERTMIDVATRMMLDQDTSLSEQVGSSLGAEACGAMQSLGIPPEVTERMQPWAVVMTLGMPQMESGLFLDKLLYERGIAAGKRFQALESAGEQLSIFNSLSLDEQKSMLRQVLREYRDYPGMFEMLTQAYLDQDLQRLMAITIANPMSSDTQLQQKMMALMLDSRNRRMAERMLPLLDQARVFVAVGALHLAGETGLIALLRQQGYKVSRAD
ncbi:MAG: TraB/GumN family protein [Candidatus Thiodiazotropha sp.]